MLGESDPDRERREWEQTVTGRLYGDVQAIAERENKTCRIEGRGGIYEFISLGDEAATLIKHLENSNVGEEGGGNLTTYAEAWEYKRLPWWKEALEKENLPVKFLETPVSKAAKDAGLENWEAVFRPVTTVKEFNLSDAADEKATGAAEDWVRSRIKEHLAPLIAADYKIDFFDGGLRLVPQTEEAKRSRLEDNDTYARTLEKIKEIAPKLEEEYRNRPAGGKMM